MRKTIAPWQKPLLLMSMLVSCFAVVAEPAHWFLWQSKFNGNMLCKQLSPGEGWQQHAGPFYDARCTKEVLKVHRTVNSPTNKKLSNTVNSTR